LPSLALRACKKMAYFSVTLITCRVQREVSFRLPILGGFLFGGLGNFLGQFARFSADFAWFLTA
jgi:hypothetical protein